MMFVWHNTIMMWNMYLSKIQPEKLTDQDTTKMVTWPQSTVTKNVIILITESTILLVNMMLQSDLSVKEKSEKS